MRVRRCRYNALVVVFCVWMMSAMPPARASADERQDLNLTLATTGSLPGTLASDVQGQQQSCEEVSSAGLEGSCETTNTGLTPYIQGGQTADLDRFPYFVNLLKPTYRKHTCGGILIDERHVLTAAHCKDFSGDDPLVYILGAKEIVSVETMFVHPEYNEDVHNGHDIALARLAKDVTNVKFPKLPQPDAQFKHNTQVSALAWNTSVDRWNPHAVEIAPELRVVEHSKCSGVVKKYMKPGLICAYSPEMRPCPGDSGGPLLMASFEDGSIMKGNPNWDKIIGIVSFGSQNCTTGVENYSTAYTAVSPYVPWIREIQNSAKSKVPWQSMLETALVIGGAIVLAGYLWQFCRNPLQRHHPYVTTEEPDVLAMHLGRHRDMPKHTVALKGRVEEVMDILRHSMTSTVALCGMAGVGKSVLATALYNEVSRSPELGKAIWITVGRAPESPFSVLQGIWKELTGKEAPCGKIDDILNLILNYLEHKCVLLVLDNVWDANDVEKLMITKSNSQSRVLITTTRKGVAKEVDPNAREYDVESLDDEASKELFCRYAFGQMRIPSNKQSLSDLVGEMVKLCGHLPQALRVIGSMTAGYKAKESWQRALRSLKTSQGQSGKMNNVLSALRVSYDDLEDDHQLMIKCLVCYPEGCHVRLGDLAEHWVALQMREAKEGFNVTDLWSDAFAILHDLQDRSLLVVEGKQGEQRPGALCYMHSLVREMGLMAGGCDSASPTHQDHNSIALSCVHHIPANERHLAVCLHSLVLREHLLPVLPPLLLTWAQLKVLDLSGSGLKTLCSDLQKLEMLEVLRLDRCSVKTLPDEMTNLRWLGVLSLRGCLLLTNLPMNLGRLVWLHSLYLQDCWALQSLPQTLTNLRSLHTCDLTNCRQLVVLPTGLQQLSHLQFFSLRGCSRLATSLGMQGDPNHQKHSLIKAIVAMNDLKKLDLNGLTNLTYIPNAVGHHLVHLEQLDLSGCTGLTGIPDCIGHLTNLCALSLAHSSLLRSIPEAIKGLLLLQHMDFNHCSSLQHLPEGIGCLTELRHLDLNGCSNLEDIPVSIGSLRQLLHLNLRGCCRLSNLPSALTALDRLQYLSLSGCLELTGVPMAVWSLKHLRHLDLSGCHFGAQTPLGTSKGEIPGAIEGLGQLVTLILNGCTSISQLPASIGSLKHLRILMLTGCTQLEHIPREMGALTRLKTLDLSGCSSLKALPELEARSWGHLQTLVLSGCSSLTSLPDLTSLEQLKCLFLSNCTALRTLPASLASLNHLRILELRGCSGLVSLPADAEWRSRLQRLDHTHPIDSSDNGFKRAFTQVTSLKRTLGRALAQSFPTRCNACCPLVKQWEGSGDNATNALPVTRE